MADLKASPHDYDFVIVGSGFGGSVSALRLAEKGYKVLVLEAGKRWRTQDFPRSNWSVRKFLWMPALFCYGIQRLTLLRDVLVLSGAGVGGGSLVYACTHLEPEPEAFLRGTWPKGIDWRKTLAPHYQTAKRMLGVTPNPHLWAGDQALLKFARTLGKEDTFEPTDVAILFGERAGQPVGDPYFGGEGPDRTTCTYCGGCMVGCRHGAKNTLDKNYLWFAERLGTEVRPETLVTGLEEDGQGGWRVHTRSSTRKIFKGKKTIRARGVVLSAGALGTTNLLLKCRDADMLPRLSPALGGYVRTNSEIICGATSRDKEADYSKGIAIASSFQPDPDTTIEVVRYPEKSDVMSFLGTLLVDDGTRPTRPLKWLGTCLRHPVDFLRTFNPVGWAKRSTIVLVMQNVDSAFRLVRERRWLWPFRKTLTSRRDPGQPPIPAYLPVANQAARSPPRRAGAAPPRPPPHRRDHQRFPVELDQRGGAERPHHGPHPGRRLHGHLAGRRRDRRPQPGLRLREPLCGGRLDDPLEPGGQPQPDHHRHGRARHEPRPAQGLHAGAAAPAGAGPGRGHGGCVGAGIGGSGGGLAQHQP